MKEYLATVRLINTIINLEQYVDSVVDYTSQYGSENSIFYSADNVKGHPSIYPSYGDFTNSFHFRKYGPWWSSELSSYNMVRSRSNGPHPRSQDFLIVTFRKKVNPKYMKIFEIYNPGALIKILSFCPEHNRWDVLWFGPPQVCSRSSREFCVNLKRIAYITNTFRLEFHHEHLSYHYALDAILLIGYIPASGVSFEHFHFPDPSVNNFKSISELESNVEVKNVKENESFNIEQLPNEVILLIFSFLDLASLCSTSQVSRLFKKLSYDSGLFHDLDLQPYWDKINASALEALEERCTSIQHLNLSWCGSEWGLAFPPIAQFLKRSCSMLSCLKLSNCDFDTEGCLKIIVDACPLLQVLELRNFQMNITENVDYMEIARLVNLKYLDLYCSFIRQEQLLSIISHCLKLEHLLLDSCFLVHNFDEISVRIAQNLSHIKTLEFRRAKTLTSVGILAIASKCFDLVEIDLGWCLGVSAASGCIIQLVTHCRKLKKLFLSAMRSVSDLEVQAIAENCTQLEQLDIVGILSVNLQSVERVLQQCLNLKLLDVSFCGSEIKSSQQRLESSYPNILIAYDIRQYHPIHNADESL